MLNFPLGLHSLPNPATTLRLVFTYRGTRGVTFSPPFQHIPFFVIMCNDFCGSTNIHLEFSGALLFFITYNCVQAPRIKFLTDILPSLLSMDFWTIRVHEMYILTIVFLTSHTTHTIHIFTCSTATIKMTPCSNNFQVAKTSYHSSLIFNSISKLQSQRSY